MRERDSAAVRKYASRKGRRLRVRVLREVYGLGPDADLPCEFCGRVFQAMTLTNEHLRPVEWGGTNDLTNIRLSCADCNWQRDQHGKACLACSQRQPCLLALAWQLPERCVRLSRPRCPLSWNQARMLRRSVARSQNLKTIVRTGRDFLYTDRRAPDSWSLPATWHFGPLPRHRALVAPK